MTGDIREPRGRPVVPEASSLAARLARENESETQLVRESIRRLSSVQGQGTREQSARIFADFDCARVPTNSEHGLNEFIADAEAANAFVSIVSMHPAVSGKRPLPVGINLFRSSKELTALSLHQQDAALLFGGLAVAIGSRRGEDEPGSEALSNAMLQIGFGASALDHLFRKALLPRLNPLWDPLRDPMADFPISPNDLSDLQKELDQRVCLAGLRHATVAMGNAVRDSREMQSTKFRVWADTITQLNPDARYAGTRVVIHNTDYPHLLPPNVQVTFPMADGGCAPVDVILSLNPAAPLTVVVPEGVGDGAVGFRETIQSNGRIASMNPSAASELGGLLVSCLGPMASVAADRIKSWVPSFPAPTCPVLRNDDANHFFGGPVLVSVNPLIMAFGETINVEGKNLEASDVIVIDGVAQNTIQTGASTLQFVAPLLSGGRHSLAIRHGAHASNKQTVLVRPVIDRIVNPEPHTPGTDIVIRGSGFAFNCSVQVDGQSALPSNVSASELTFKIFRPAGVALNKFGEPVSVVVNNSGLTSNAVQTVLQTYRIAVFGDSVAWGQGLLQVDKYSQLVANHLRISKPDIGVYNDDDDVSAHSGATIGVIPKSPVELLKLPPEVPTSYRTILEQVEEKRRTGLAAQLECVGLVLLNGGANDVGIGPISLGAAVSQEGQFLLLRDSVRMHCHASMLELLTKTLSTFPSAKIVVTGYYSVISYDSAPDELADFLLGIGVAVTGIAGILAWGGAALLRDFLAENWKAFATAANEDLQHAVNDARAAFPQRKIEFAAPAFLPRNAAFAPESWLWEFQGPLQLQDPVSAERADHCHANKDAVGHNVKEWTCRNASLGHPNVLGARAYFDAIVPFL